MGEPLKWISKGTSCICLTCIASEKREMPSTVCGHISEFGSDSLQSTVNDIRPADHAFAMWHIHIYPRRSKQLLNWLLLDCARAKLPSGPCTGATETQLHTLTAYSDSAKGSLPLLKGYTKLAKSLRFAEIWPAYSQVLRTLSKQFCTQPNALYIATIPFPESILPALIALLSSMADSTSPV